MKHHEKGATLSQLLIVLATVATLIGVGAQSVIGFLPNFRLTQATRALFVTIQKAKLQAIQRCAVHYLDFDFDGDGNVVCGRYVLWEDRNDNHHKDHLERMESVLDPTALAGVSLQAYPCQIGGPERGPNNTNVDAGGGDGITFNLNRIKFNPNGTSSAGTVYLHSSTGRTFAIRLRSNGLVQLWRHDGAGWER